MGIAGIIGLVLSLAPQAINLEQLIEGAIQRRRELQNKPNRSDVENEELEAVEALIDAVQKRINDRAAAASSDGNG